MKQVKQGDLIVELSNPKLVQDLAQTQWELEAMLADYQAAKVNQESQFLEQKSRVLDAKMRYESSALRFNAQAELLETGAVSKITYQRTELETHQLLERWKISEQRLKKMEENLVAQENARLARLTKTRKMLEHQTKLVDDLQVKATMNAVVLDIPLELGQRITLGTNIAKLANQNSLIAELQIPEIQIQKVIKGQKVIIDTRKNLIQGRVTRVDPSVNNGNVQIDVTLLSELPAESRPDLSVDGEIIIAEAEDTLFVNRPLFSQSQSMAALFKISKDGHFAHRIPVELGQGSINQIEVLSGLEVGDLIVTSDPTRFEHYEKIRIN